MQRLSAILVLLVTASLKVAALIHQPPLLEQQDPILGTSLKVVLVGALLVETVVLLALLRIRDRGAAALVILTFIVPASLYRLAAHLAGGAACPCLGQPSGWWPWLAYHDTMVLNTLAAWLFLSSVWVVETRLRS